MNMPSADGPTGIAERLLERLVAVRSGETRAMLWSFPFLLPARRHAFAFADERWRSSAVRNL
jgi:hypothetical protein